jgi:FkbM family methyltransferase
MVDYNTGKRVNFGVVTSPSGMSETALLLHRYRILGVDLQVYDFAESHAAYTVAQELACDIYKLRCISFRPGDCVVDIGGHLGMFSITLALRNPFLRIYAYEPHPDNYALFQRHLALNRVSNVELYPEALSGDGRPLDLRGSAINSGAASALAATLSDRCVFGIPSLTLDQVFARHGIARCRLLKIDCEGLEYEILSATRIWDRVDHLCGEFHTNKILASRNCSPKALREFCAQQLAPKGVAVSFCRMSE